MWYQSVGAGGSGLTPAFSALMMLVKRNVGAGMLREMAWEMRVLRVRRKERVGDMVGVV